MKIYTRTGDAGETSLFDGTRVRKDDARVDAYGDVDELNAWLGFARSSLAKGDLDDELARLQRDLFALGAQLADPADRIAKRVTKATLTDADVERFEQVIDRLELELPPLRRFILAGGTPSGAALAPGSRPCVAAPSAASSRSSLRSIWCFSNTSIDCPIFFSSSPEWPTSEPEWRKSNGDGVHGRSRRSMSRLTASNTARASSCDTRSLIAPHSTKTAVEVVSIATSHRSRAIPSGRSSKVVTGAGPSDVARRDTTAAIGDPLISTRTAVTVFLSIDCPP